MHVYSICTVLTHSHSMCVLYGASVGVTITAKALGPSGVCSLLWCVGS